jgi:predicted Fe-Mo cluster-binding NifX family protein
MSEHLEERPRVIAVPSQAPGGLEAQRSGHFGHCDCFTLVDVAGEGVAGVRVIANAPHHEGGCLDPVNMLASLGATEIVVSGMGARPLAFFGQLGITVYADQERSKVQDVVDALLEGGVPVMSTMHVCGGGACH